MMRILKKHHDIFDVKTRRVKLLSKIIKKTGAKVVLSSSWRHGWYRPYEEKGDRQKTLHDKLLKYNIEVIGITDTVQCGKYFSHRESEIRKWLSEHTDQVNGFVILDDEQSDLQGFIGKELVKTSETEDIKGAWYENTGLKRKHVKQAIKILNGIRYNFTFIGIEVNEDELLY
jgi:hypothetical protein